MIRSDQFLSLIDNSCKSAPKNVDINIEVVLHTTSSYIINVYFMQRHRGSSVVFFLFFSWPLYSLGCYESIGAFLSCIWVWEGTPLDEMSIF